ncbi:hypothetical protein ACPZ19_19525 [Amycolatopsis lurida]
MERLLRRAQGPDDLVDQLGRFEELDLREQRQGPPGPLRSTRKPPWACARGGLAGPQVLKDTFLLACNCGGNALYLAAQAVKSGQADCVLALGFEKMRPGSLGSTFDDRSQEPPALGASPLWRSAGRPVRRWRSSGRR